MATAFRMRTASMSALLAGTKHIRAEMALRVAADICFIFHIYFF